jgi:hypothetical protein
MTCSFVMRMWAAWQLVAIGSTFALPCGNDTWSCELASFPIDPNDGDDFNHSRSVCESNNMSLVTPLGSKTLKDVQDKCNTTYFGLVHPSSGLIKSGMLPSSTNACVWHDVDDPSVSLTVDDRYFWDNNEPDGGGNNSGTCMNRGTVWPNEPCTAFFLCNLPKPTCPFVADIPCSGSMLSPFPKCVVCAKRTGSPPSTIQTQKTTKTSAASSTPTPPDTPVGVIVGAAIGSLSLIVLLLLVVICVLARKRRSKSTEDDVSLDTKAQPASDADTVYGSLTAATHPNTVPEYDDPSIVRAPQPNNSYDSVDSPLRA